MSKISSFIYSATAPGVAAGSPKSGCATAITITANNMICVRVPFFSEGYVKQVVVKQKTGTSAAFVVEILSSVIPYAVGLASNSTAPSGTIELYRILPSQSLAAGEALDVKPDTDLGYPFRNVDGDYTMNSRYIYLVIKPTGNSDTSTWDAMILGQSNCND